MCSSHAINRNFFRKTLGFSKLSVGRLGSRPGEQDQRREEAVAEDDRTLSAAALNSRAYLHVTSTSRDRGTRDGDADIFGGVDRTGGYLDSCARRVGPRDPARRAPPPRTRRSSPRAPRAHPPPRRGLPAPKPPERSLGAETGWGRGGGGGSKREPGTQRCAGGSGTFGAH